MNEARYLAVSAVNSHGVESASGYVTKVAFSNTAPSITGIGAIFEGGWNDYSLGVPDTRTEIMLGGTAVETAYKLEFLTSGSVLIDTYDLGNLGRINSTFNTLTDYLVDWIVPTDGPFSGIPVLDITFNVSKAIYSTVGKIRLTNYTGSSTYDVTWL
jgi:hypothetical protein